METIFKKEEITVIQKRSEDNISTSNPKAKLPCEKKITNVYMAKKKSVMILEDESADLQEVKKNYIALTSLNISEEYRLPKPSELDVGNSINIEYEVYVVKKGDTLGAIDSDWEGLAKLNKVDPKKLRIGQYLLVPLEKSKQATLRKEIELEETQEVNVGDCVHLVTEVEGFRKGESVLTKINEEDKITKSDELLTVTQHDKAKTEFLAVVEENEDDPTKGLAVSEELIVTPPIEKRENNTTDTTKKDWKEKFTAIEDKNVTLKVKVSSFSLPNEEEVESEEVKLEKRQVKVSLDYMRATTPLSGAKRMPHDKNFGKKVDSLIPLYLSDPSLYEKQLNEMVDEYGKKLKSMDYSPREVKRYKFVKRTNLQYRVKHRTRNVRKDDYVEGFGVSLDVGIGLVEGTGEIGVFIGQKKKDKKIIRYCGYYRALEGGGIINLNHLSNAETHLKDFSEQLNEKKIRNKLGASGSVTFIDGNAEPFIVFEGTYKNVATYFGPFSHSVLSNDPNEDGIYDNEVAETWDFQLFGSWDIGSSVKMGVGSVFGVRESTDYGKTWHDYIPYEENKNED